MSETVQYFVLWCGSECAGNPHLTREAAQKWIRQVREDGRRYGGMYGSYTIEERMKAAPAPAPRHGE